MSEKKRHDDPSFSEEETARRRDAVLKRMLNTPHKPHAEQGRKSAPPKPDSQRSNSKGRHLSK